LVLKDSKEHKDFKVIRDSKALKGLKDSREHRVFKVYRD
jgi:hypothetical protein